MNKITIKGDVGQVFTGDVGQVHVHHHPQPEMKMRGVLVWFLVSFAAVGWLLAIKSGIV